MIRSEDLLRVKKMILHPPHKRGIPFIAGCSHSPGKGTCSGFLPKTNSTRQSCSLYIALRHKDSTTHCNGHVQEHAKHIEAAVTLRSTPRLGRPNPARARRTRRGTLHRWLQPASSPGQVRHATFHRFRAPASQTPCKSHAATTMRFAAPRGLLRFASYRPS